MLFTVGMLLDELVWLGTIWDHFTTDLNDANEVVLMMLMMRGKQMQFRDGEGALRMNLISQMDQQITWNASMIVHL